MNKIFPIGHDEASKKLHEDIAKILMEFVCHNQKAYSKALNKFIATGCHDIRAGGVALEILRLVQDFFDEDSSVDIYTDTETDLNDGDDPPLGSGVDPFLWRRMSQEERKPIIDAYNKALNELKQNEMSKM